VFLGPAYGWKVLNAGGGSPATPDAQIIDLGDPEPAWRPIAPMAHPRWFPNSALLPDGKLLVVGGGRFYNEDPVMEPEIFDPATETWTLDVPMEVPRLYHSTALLLPDGRVWVAGRDGEVRMELYSPDYLFGGPRPILWDAPQSVAYGQLFTIPMPDAADVVSICMIRLSVVTHAFNMGQRYVPLAFEVSGPEEVQVWAPFDPYTAPPGHYMLFIMNGAGVPGVAPIIQLLAVAPVDEGGPRFPELEAQLAEKERQIAELANVVGYLTGDVVTALRATLRLRRLRDMKTQVTNIANEIERHRRR
jgi:galactose oxidase